MLRLWGARSNPESLSMFNQVTIVGCGLLGGSFAQAVRRAGLANQITACGGTRSPQAALERGVIDAVETTLDEQNDEQNDEQKICEADLIFLAAPIGGIIDFLKTRGARLKSGAIITDAGSTKMEICRTATACLPQHVTFIGGHPMAGSEHTGVEFARADLFERATWALMENFNGEQATLEKLETLVRKIGARPLRTTPEKHDEAVALISHLPQLLATTLAGLLASHDSTDEGDSALKLDLARRLAATGWRDMTRLAGSSWSVWRDIVITNQPQITTALNAMIAELEELRAALTERDFNQTRDAFALGNYSVEQLRQLHLQSFEKLKKS